MEIIEIIKNLETLQKSLSPEYSFIIDELDGIINKIKEDKNCYFTLSEYNLKKLDEWNKDHLKECHKGKEPYAGCTGGRLTFSFTSTSLGEIQTVKCGLCEESGKCVKCRGPKKKPWVGELTDWDNFG